MEEHECYSTEAIPLGKSTQYCDECGAPTANVRVPSQLGIDDGLQEDEEEEASE